MKTIDIKGKPYIEVNERIKHFWELYSPDKCRQINTIMLSNENGICIFKAEIWVGGEILATGHAYEKEGSTFINKTSYIENCETSAVGRALGILGIGIDTSIASAEEVQNAIANQGDKKKPEKEFTKTSADFEMEMDQHATVKSLANWWIKNNRKMKKELSENDFIKAEKYKDQLKATLENHEKKKHKMEDDVPLFTEKEPEF